MEILFVSCWQFNADGLWNEEDKGAEAIHLLFNLRLGIPVRADIIYIHDGYLRIS